MSSLSRQFKERVMANIRSHEQMAALYLRARREGFTLAKDPDRRGVVVGMPKDMKAGDVLEGPLDPRFATLAELMEHDGELFDFLETTDRLIQGVFDDDEGCNPVAGEEFIPPAEALPLVAGGQGRDAEEVRADARALGFVIGLGAMCVGLSIGTVCLALGRWPWQLFE